MIRSDRCHARFPMGAGERWVEGGNETRAVYTIREIAARTGFSRQTITRLLEREPGVLVVSRAETLDKRRYGSARNSL